MKKLLYSALCMFALCASAGMFTSCLGDEPGSDDNWRERNEKFMTEKEAETDAQGQPVYTRVNCKWDPNGYVLMKWHNNRALTQGKLSPLSTSTVDVKYHVSNIEGTGLDSSYYRTVPADSVYRSVLNKNIQGWQIALTNMHIGDSCTVIIPYNQAYGVNTQGSIKAYSDLIFNVKLVGIPAYERPL